MADYLTELDAAPAADRWKMARNWLFNEPLPFFAALREHRPVLVLPEVTLVTRHADCNLILRRHQTFGVDLYKPKQGDYFMAQDDTATHWREKSIMKAILDREDIPDLRAWIGERTKEILAETPDRVEVVRALSRGVPVKLIQDWFGFTRSDPDKLIEWSYWNQQDAFWNQPFDAHWVPDQQAIVDARNAANRRLAFYLARLAIRRRLALAVGAGGDDPTTRLLQVSGSDGMKFGFVNVVQNVGGLLIGAVETTNHTVVNALDVLLSNPDWAKSAIAAAQEEDPTLLDGHVFEALRFRPAFPYFFRTVKRDTELAGGTPHATTVKTGSTVLAVTHSAMFDPAGFPNPEEFDPTRDQSDSFTFGQGIHTCLGRAIAGVMVPEIIRQTLRHRTILDAETPVYKNQVPEDYVIRFAA